MTAFTAARRTGMRSGRAVISVAGLSQRRMRSAKPRRAAPLFQRRHLVPVDMAGGNFGHRPGDAQARQPGHAPPVHRVLLLDGLVRPGGSVSSIVPPATRSDGRCKTRPIPRMRRIQPAFPRAARARIPGSPLPAWRYSLPSSVSNNVSIANMASAGNGRGLGVLASTVALGARHSHPYEPWPVPWSAGHPARTRAR